MKLYCEKCPQECEGAANKCILNLMYNEMLKDQERQIETMMQKLAMIPRKHLESQAEDKLKVLETDPLFAQVCNMENELQEVEDRLLNLLDQGGKKL